MKKRIIAFYDVLIVDIISTPFTICSIFFFVFADTSNLEWLCKNWYLIIFASLGVSLPVVGIFWITGYTLIMNNHYVLFYYFPHAKTWKKMINNIDIRWNQELFISEVLAVNIVKLTKEEKKHKVFYKHIRNKYLEIIIKNGGTKYVYVGNYAQCQIKKIMKILLKE
jgi:hypothetical protein